MKIIGRCKICGRVIGRDGLGIEYELHYDKWGIPYWIPHKCKEKLKKKRR